MNRLRISCLVLSFSLLVAGAALAGHSQASPQASSPAVASPQTPAVASSLTAAEILAKAGAAYADIQTLHGEGTLTTESVGPGQSSKMEASFVFDLGSASKMRMELKSQTAGDVTMVYDGQTMWLSMPQMNVYAKMPLGGSPSQSVDATGLPGMNAYPERFTRNVREAHILRGETLPLNGQNVDCYVIDATYVPSSPSAKMTIESSDATLWIDKDTFLVVSSDSGTKTKLQGAAEATTIHQILKFGKLEVGAPLAAGLFSFTPPEGAKELDLSALLPSMPSKATAKP